MIHNIKEGTKIPLEQDAWLLQQDDILSVIQLHIDKEHTLESHINEDKVVFYVLEGKGLISVDDKEFETRKGDLIEVDAGRERCWKNAGDQTLKLLVIKHSVS